MRAVGFLLNRYRAEIVPMLVLALVVVVTAFLAAAGPRLFNRVADDGLRYDVGRAKSIDRNLELGQIGNLSGGSGLQSVADRGPELEAELPESVRELIADRTYHAESTSWAVYDPPREHPTWLRFRFPDGVEERITYVEGRPPTGETTTIPGRPGTLPTIRRTRPSSRSRSRARSPRRWASGSATASSSSPIPRTRWSASSVALSARRSTWSASIPWTIPPTSSG